ncbi:lysylphosphatidylglycerol synthase domain-containing protein [Thalassiella azotivora]
MTVPGGAARPAAGGRRRLLTAAAYAALVAAVGLGVWSVWRDREAVGASLASVGPGAAVAALVVTVLGVVCTGESWRLALRLLGHRLPLLTAHRLFYVTQAGKYVPGSVWPFAAQVAVAHRFHLPRRVLPLATTVFLVVHLATGAVVAGATLPAEVLPVPGGLLVAGGLAGVALTVPPLLRVLLSRLEVLRPTRAVAGPGGPGGPGDEVASAPTHASRWLAWAGAVCWLVLAWLAYGAALWLVAAPLGAGPGDGPLAVGAFALGWSVGLLAVVAPAGAGVRDGLLVLVMGTTLPGAAALTVALVVRVAGVVADLGLAAASASLLRPDRQATPRAGDGDPTAGG